MNIKIFGGSGFIGRHLSRHLLNMNHEVTILDLKKPNIMGIDLYNYDMKWDSPLRFIKTNIKNYEDVFYNIYPGDYVINLAAISQFTQADNEPHTTMSVNVAGATNVIKACIMNRASKLIYTSTGSVYSKESTIPIDENQPTKPDSVYGMSKLWAEQIQQHYADKIPLTILRLPYVVGPGKTWGANSFIVKLRNNEKPIVFGDGSNRNDFTHVTDITNAISLSLNSNKTGIFNIGSGESRSTLEFLNCVKKFTGKTNIDPLFISERKVDFKNFVYNIDKAKRELGYSPKMNFEQTIKKTCSEWDDWL